MNKCLAIALTLAILPADTYAAMPEEAITPIGGLILVVLIIMGFTHMLKQASKQPVMAIRRLTGFCIAIVIGFGIPLFLTKYYELGNWLGAVWIASWLIAGKVWFLIAEFKDEAP